MGGCGCEGGSGWVGAIRSRAFVKHRPTQKKQGTGAAPIRGTREGRAHCPHKQPGGVAQVVRCARASPGGAGVSCCAAAPAVAAADIVGVAFVHSAAAVRPSDRKASTCIITACIVGACIATSTLHPPTHPCTPPQKNNQAAHLGGGDGGGGRGGDGGGLRSGRGRRGSTVSPSQRHQV